MFASIVAHTLGLDQDKMIKMAGIHDVAELITLDLVTAVLDGEERKRALREKRQLEEAAMHEIFDPMGEWGRECYELWAEYADQTSPEARVLKDLDKLEACIQAVLYRQQGHQIVPSEFLDYASTVLEHPDLIEVLNYLRELAQETTPAYRS